MTLRPPRVPGREPSVRTPSAAVLVQALFLFGAIGTGVASALATWLAPRREPPRPEQGSSEKPEPRDE